ncbi:LacI family DNA-binding transcriptional regulator [Hyphomonas oceanitis]|nr:LacI family DNA-binding transcriptional regulator [Hyphomonas oceanitis]
MSFAVSIVRHQPILTGQHLNQDQPLKQGQVTLQDVANRAGVSIATASRVIGDGKVKAATREKVEQAIRDLGYFPNAAARTLRGEKSMTVGVVFNELNGSLATELLDSLASRLHADGYSLFVATAQGSEQQYDELVQRFAERRVDALLCVNAMGEGAALTHIRALGIPAAAVFGRRDGYRELPLIMPTIQAAAFACGERLKALGHETIGIVYQATSRPLTGFRYFMKEMGFSVNSYDLAETGSDAVAFINRYMLDPNRPTALIAHQKLAAELFDAADQMAIMIPQDISLIGIRDQTQNQTATRRPLSTIHLDPATLGLESASRLVRILKNGEDQGMLSETHIEMAKWVERDTTGSANK